MADRMKPMGMDRALVSKVAGKYDPGSEKEVRDWFQQLLGENIEAGPIAMEKALKDGILLIKLLQKVYDGSPNKPPACDRIKLKFTTMSAPFKQMENIEIFLKGAEAYGVQNTSLFQTVDLYEGRNMPMVLNTILQVGTEAQRHGFGGETIGARPCDKHKVEFTLEQLRNTHSILTKQSALHVYANQKGMRAMGAVRHISDIRADDMNQEGQGTLSLQAGTNRFASQKGMAMGAIRHISDIRADDCVKEGESHLSLQAGTNRYASQKGMTGFGAIRHISDIRCDDASQEGANILGLLSRSNAFASQKGMNIGSIRHCADINVNTISDTYDQKGSQMYAPKVKSE